MVERCGLWDPILAEPARARHATSHRAWLPHVAAAISVGDLTRMYVRKNMPRMIELKLTTIGNSLGVVLPKEALARLKVAKGDTLYITETPDGYRLTPYNPDFEQQMAAARKIMKKRRAALRELAK